MKGIIFLLTIFIHTVANCQQKYDHNTIFHFNADNGHFFVFHWPNHRVSDSSNCKIKTVKLDFVPVSDSNINDVNLYTDSRIIKLEETDQIVELDFIPNSILLKSNQSNAINFTNAVIRQIQNTNRNGDVNYQINNKITFYNCVISQLFIKADDSSKHVIFNDTVSFINCTFIDEASFSNCIFMKPVMISNCFNNLFRNKINFNNCSFENTFFFSSNPEYSHNANYSLVFDSTIRYHQGAKPTNEITIDNCKFNGETSIYNPLKSVNIDLSNSEFKKVVWLANCEPYDNKKTVQSSLYNFNASHCTFKGMMFFASLVVRNSTIDYSIVSNTFYFRNSLIDSSSNFSKLIFTEDVAIITNNGNFDYSQLGIANSSIANTFFPFLPTSNKERFSEESRTIYRDFNARLVVSMSSYLKDYPEIVQELKERTKHIQTEYEIFYYWHNQKYLHFVWFGFLQVVVNNGYHGESNFFLTVIITILIFSIIFYIWFRDAAIEYFNQQEDRAVGHYTAGPNFLTFVQCLWFSTWVFINPKMPMHYFKMKSNLFKIVVVEWFIGLTFIVLFIIFILIKYPFIKALFG